MKKLSLIILLLTNTFLQATVIVPGNGGTILPPVSTTFTHPVSAKVFDRANGVFYAGLSVGGGTYSLSMANRPSYGPNSIFTPIGTQIPFNSGDAIKFLTLATSTGNPSPNLGVVILPRNGQNPKVVVASNSNGSTVTESQLINDASGATNMDGLPTSGIVGLAANQFFMFPAVSPCNGLFGANCKGGIASVAINQTDLTLTQVPAIPGDGGIKAQVFDSTTPAIYINNSPTITPNKVDMYWDDPLQRLYIGIQLTTAATPVGVTCVQGTGICVTGTFTCPTGFKPDLAEMTCVVCPSGGFYNPAIEDCQSCPSGQTFNPSSFTCVNVTCPATGFFKPGVGCVTCPTGFFYDQTVSMTCITCPNGGYYNPNDGTCVACPSGQSFDPNSGSCTGSPTCPSGQMWDPSIPDCILICPSGFHFDFDNFTCSPNSGTTGDIPPLEPDIPPFLGFNGPLGTYSAFGQHNYAGPRGATRSNPQSRIPGPSGGRSVVVAQIDSSGAITLYPIAPDSAFADNDTTRMVGVLSDAPETLTINKVRVLHASTGPSYLIINGGNGDSSTTGNMLFALPLVDLGNAADPAQGTLANINSALVDYKFVVPALSPGDLASSSDAAVMIGAGPLGIPPASSISDIDVVGDTVYVSIDNSITANTEGGVLYSQALFDQDGKILRWTPWTKKAFPLYTTSSQTNASAVKFFAVDAVTSKVWAVDGTGFNVLQTSWDNATTSSTTLLAQINKNITGAASAVLDLDQSTRGFLSNHSRYSLFAGDASGKTDVLFARVSQSLGSAINSPQLITTDYTLANNFLVTMLPTATCQIQMLEYARQLAGTPTNYFFAGTQNGLYVFSDGGIGFDVSTMGNLNAPPFSNGSWELAPTISGNVIDIKTTGNVLYVLVQNSVMQSTLYRIVYQPTVAAMFASGNITLIAQTGITPFTNIVTFNGIEIISTQPNGSTEQVILATNNGLFNSSRPGGVQAAVSQADAAWVQIPNTNFYYNGIAEFDNASIPIASPSTVWPFHLATDSANALNTFDQSVLQQLSGSADAGPFNFVPPFFNSIIAGDVASPFATIPLITSFWSDGARRIAAVANVQSSCTPEELLSLPFDTIQWDIENPDDALIDDPVLNNVSAFYWIKQLGVTGILMAGTGMGVVALE